VSYNETELANEGTGTGVYFQNGPTPKDLSSIPRRRSEAITEGWTSNSCFPGMGKLVFGCIYLYVYDNL